MSLASPVWASMLNGEFAESNSTSIEFKEDDPSAMRYAFEAIYSNLSACTPLSDGYRIPEVEYLCDKYQLDGVRAQLKKRREDHERGVSERTTSSEWLRLERNARMTEREDSGRRLASSEESYQRVCRELQELRGRMARGETG